MGFEVDRTEQEQLILSIVSSVAAVISICCALYIILIVLRSKYNRSRIYHRIMMGCGINIIILSTTTLMGNVPLHAGPACSASGFLYQYALGVTPSYYFALLILSYVAFKNKFNFSKVNRLEKIFHVGIHTLYLSSSLYLLSLDAFNPVDTGCSLASLPVGCGDHSGVPCTRGPQNISQLQMVFWGIPTIICLFGSVLVMFLFYFYVRKLGEKARPIAYSVAKQSGLYLLILILIYSFRMIYTIMIHGFGVYSYTMGLLANTNEALIGVWILIVYWYFRSDDPTLNQQDGDKGDQITPAYKINCSKEDFISIILRRISFISRGSTSTVSRDEESRVDEDSESKASRGSQQASKKPEFSIFDGNTIPEDSPWAEFLTEGEDEEYRNESIWQQ